MAFASRVKHVVLGDYVGRYLVYACLFMLGIDLVYKSIWGITYQNRQDCILYTSLPRWGFLIYEHFVELAAIVMVGIFIAALLERHINRYGRFVPRSAVTAFVYASVVPVCSCSTIPLIKALGNRIPFRAIIAFVVGAPLLNPYIIVLSISILGPGYAVLRIICSFVLAVGTGYAVERFHKGPVSADRDFPGACRIAGGCGARRKDVFDATLAVFRSILPFLLIAGTLGLFAELYFSGHWLDHFDLSDNLMGTIAVILCGVPVYFCNGADVLFLQPLIQHSNLPLGAAMAFSLTSTSVCMSSLVLLLKFLGRRLTWILLSCVVVTTFLLSLLIHLISPVWV
jgi:uncharacterized membrane protein YraQ (UPF0718 family)